MDESISSNRRRVLLGITAFVITSLALTVLMAVWILSNYESTYGWTIFALLVAVEVCSIWLATSSGLRVVMWLSNAAPIGDSGLLLAEDVVDDIALAAGVTPPEVMYIEQEYCNSFSMKLGKREVIFVTRGMVKKLDREELRAVIGHEMAHLYHGDATFNTFLASLRSFYLNVRLILSSFFSEELVLGLLYVIMFMIFCLVIAVAVFLSSEGTSFSDITDWTRRALLPIAPILMMIANVVVAFAFATIMQHFVDDSREFLADETSVRWTMNPEALIGALRKAKYEGQSVRLRFLKNIFFVPMVTSDRQPTVNERISHLDQTLHLGLNYEPVAGIDKLRSDRPLHALRRLIIGCCIVLACAGIGFGTYYLARGRQAAEIVVPLPPGWQDIRESDEWNEEYWKEHGGSVVDAYYPLKPDALRDYRDNTTIMAYHNSFKETSVKEAPVKKTLTEAEVQDVLEKNVQSFTGAYYARKYQGALQSVAVEQFDCGEYAIHVRYFDPDYHRNDDRYYFFKNGYEHVLQVLTNPYETGEVTKFLKQNVKFK